MELCLNKQTCSCRYRLPIQRPQNRSLEFFLHLLIQLLSVLEHVSKSSPLFSPIRCFWFSVSTGFSGGNGSCGGDGRSRFRRKDAKNDPSATKSRTVVTFLFFLSLFHSLSFCFPLLITLSLKSLLLSLSGSSFYFLSLSLSLSLFIHLSRYLLFDLGS